MFVSRFFKVFVVVFLIKLNKLILWYSTKILSYSYFIIFRKKLPNNSTFPLNEIRMLPLTSEIITLVNICKTFLKKTFIALMFIVLTLFFNHFTQSSTVLNNTCRYMRKII